MKTTLLVVLLLLSGPAAAGELYRLLQGDPATAAAMESLSQADRDMMVNPLLEHDEILGLYRVSAKNHRRSSGPSADVIVTKYELSQATLLMKWILDCEMMARRFDLASWAAVQGGAVRELQVVSEDIRSLGFEARKGAGQGARSLSLSGDRAAGNHARAEITIHPSSRRARDHLIERMVGNRWGATRSVNVSRMEPAPAGEICLEVEPPSRSPDAPLSFACLRGNVTVVGAMPRSRVEELLARVYSFPVVGSLASSKDDRTEDPKLVLVK